MTAAPFLRILCSMLTMRSRRLLTIVVAVSILILSLIPKPPEIAGGVHFADKIAHFIAYAALGFLITVSFFNGQGRAWKVRSGNVYGSRNDSSPGNRKQGGGQNIRRSAGMRRFTTVLIVAVLCILFGGLIEYLQTFTGRQAELWDMAADLTGAVCGALVGSWFNRRFLSKQE